MSKEIKTIKINEVEDIRKDPLKQQALATATATASKVILLGLMR